MENQLKQEYNKTTLYKGRIRLKRNKTTSLSDLPLDVQNNFRVISNLIKDYFKKDVDVYLFGSYLYGMYDEQSDYDVIINTQCDRKELQKIFEDLSIKVDIFITEDKEIKALLIN